MSRVGKKLIPLPKGVKITVGEQLLVEGPKGKQTVPVPTGITFREKDGILELVRDGDDKAALHGLTRALTANAVQGVSTGFTRELDIVGIGYRCDMKGRIASFTLGYSHPIEYFLPEGVDLKVDKQTHLVLTGSDKQVIGQVAANMRALRPPDPYKNKGVRYTGEVLRKKVGKTGAEASSEMARVSKNEIRLRVHQRIRRRLSGTEQRPRLAVFRSVKHIYAQVIDDAKGHTVVAASSNEKKAASGKSASGGNIAGAKAIGALIAERAKEQGIKAVVFDRGGYQYHGRVKALAEAAREAGLEF